MIQATHDSSRKQADSSRISKMCAMHACNGSNNKLGTLNGENRYATPQKGNQRLTAWHWMQAVSPVALEMDPLSQVRQKGTPAVGAYLPAETHHKNTERQGSDQDRTRTEERQLADRRTIGCGSQFGTIQCNQNGATTKPGSRQRHGRNSKHLRGSLCRPTCPSHPGRCPPGTCRNPRRRRRCQGEHNEMNENRILIGQVIQQGSSMKSKDCEEADRRSYPARSPDAHRL